MTLSRIFNPDAPALLKNLSERFDLLKAAENSFRFQKTYTHYDPSTPAKILATSIAYADTFFTQFKTEDALGDFLKTESRNFQLDTIDHWMSTQTVEAISHKLPLGNVAKNAFDKNAGGYIQSSIFTENLYPDMQPNLIKTIDKRANEIHVCLSAIPGDSCFLFCTDDVAIQTYDTYKSVDKKQDVFVYIHIPPECGMYGESFVRLSPAKASSGFEVLKLTALPPAIDENILKLTPQNARDETSKSHELYKSAYKQYRAFLLAVR